MSSRADYERLAILVHEVRSPVAALSAIAETFGDTNVEHVVRSELARLALAACSSIERVVSDAALASVRLELVDLGALVRDSAATASLTGAPVQVQVAADVPLVEVDPLRVRQALDNLVSNALTHSGSEDDVIVSAVVDGEFVLLSVSDRGMGVTPDNQNRIFEAGVRLDPSRPGSGLGLAVTRAIAEAHGGGLTVESIPGEGATFRLALPIRC